MTLTQIADLGLSDGNALWQKLSDSGTKIILSDYNAQKSHFLEVNSDDKTVNEASTYSWDNKPIR